MSFIGIRAVDDAPGGFDKWCFDHDNHHRLVTQSLNRAVSVTGNTTINSKNVSGLSSTTGLYVNMGISGSGIPANAVVTGIDTIAGNLNMSVAATATATGVSLTLVFSPIPFFILNPVNLSFKDQFLLDHQLSHNAINGLLGVTGADLEDVDFNDEAQVKAWLDLDFIEHQTWMTMTGVT